MIEKIRSSFPETADTHFSSPLFFTRDELKQKQEAKAKDKQTLSNKTPSLFKKSSWAKLRQIVFQIDISTCKHCKSEMRLISSIKDPMVIKKILSHCGLRYHSISHRSSSLSSSTYRLRISFQSSSQRTPLFTKGTFDSTTT